MKYCCAMFQDLLESVGKRGLSVVVIDSSQKSERYVFLLQARATDADQPFMAVTAYPVTTIMTMGIAYCPACGQDLCRFYAHTILPVHPELASSWNDSHRRLESNQERSNR